MPRTNANCLKPEILAHRKLNIVKSSSLLTQGLQLWQDLRGPIATNKKNVASTSNQSTFN